MREVVLAVLTAATPSPSGSASSGPPKALDPNKVSPGLDGFLAVAVLALVVIFLIRSMVGRIRRIRYRAERSGELDGPGVMPETAPRPRPLRSSRPIAAETPGAPGDPPGPGVAPPGPEQP